MPGREKYNKKKSQSLKTTINRTHEFTCVFMVSSMLFDYPRFVRKVVFQGRDQPIRASLT